MSGRKQYTSCDACRKSRLGCNAAQTDGPCANCARRKINCSSKWIEQRPETRRKRPRTTKDETRKLGNSVDTAVSDNTTPRTTQTVSERNVVASDILDTNVESDLNRRQQALTLHHVLWDIFTNLFEPQLGLWIGNDCNPLRTVDTAPKTLVSRLMVTLDNLTPQYLDYSRFHVTAFPDILFDSETATEQNIVVSQALISAVHAFSARWLPVASFSKVSTTNLQASIRTKDYFLENLWKRAHTYALRVITRASYRSILALYLFGTTPTTSQNKDRCIVDHCFETALRQYLQLRARSCNKQFRSAEVSHTDVRLANFSMAEQAEREFRHLENTAYWFGVVIDGSRSLTRCQPSVLLPGVQGEDGLWLLVKQQTLEFSTTYASVASSKVPLTETMVMTAIQHGSACKTLFWKSISQLQDHLVYQSQFLSLSLLLKRVFEETELFENAFNPFFDKCARDWILLSEKSRLSYFILAFHFHLGILILVDLLDQNAEATSTEYCLDEATYRLSSTRAVFNLANLVLLQGNTDVEHETTSIILKDPYPEHTRNGLARAAYSVLHLHRNMLLNKHIAETMAAPMFGVLEILTQVSYSALESLQHLRRAYSNAGLALTPRLADLTRYLTAVPSSLNGAVMTETFDEETVNQLDLAGSDPLLVDKTIERHEVNEFFGDLEFFDLDGFDVSSVMQEWSFEDCFTQGL